MPIYAYKCSSCGYARDVLQKLSDAPLTVCPECGKPTFAKQVTAAGFQLKGSGWYVTDFRDGNKGGGKPADKAGEGGAKSESADGGAATGESSSGAGDGGGKSGDAPGSKAGGTGGADKGSGGAPAAAPAPAATASSPPPSSGG